MAGGLAIPGIADMLAINPGVEGIGTVIDGKTTVVLPHELVGAKLLAAKKPSAAVKIPGVVTIPKATVLPARSMVRRCHSANAIYPRPSCWP